MDFVIYWKDWKDIHQLLINWTASKMGVDILGFAYAATVAAGGIMGYAKAG